MKHILLVIGLLLAAGTCKASPDTSQAERYAWELAGNGTKPVECYFWVTKTEVSAVACKPLIRPTDDLVLIVPSNALYVYHTHPKGFPELSGLDRAIEKKTGIKIRVIYH